MGTKMFAWFHMPPLPVCRLPERLANCGRTDRQRPKQMEGERRERQIQAAVPSPQAISIAAHGFRTSHFTCFLKSLLKKSDSTDKPNLGNDLLLLIVRMLHVNE